MDLSKAAANSINNNKLISLVSNSIVYWNNKSGDLFILSMLTSCNIHFLTTEAEEKQKFGDHPKTMCTDGIDIYISLSFVKSQGMVNFQGQVIEDREEAERYIKHRCQFVLGHEVYHIVNKHVERSQNEGYCPIMANICEDVVINESLYETIGQKPNFKPIVFDKGTCFDEHGNLNNAIWETSLNRYTKAHFGKTLPKNVSHENFEKIYERIKAFNQEESNPKQGQKKSSDPGSNDQTSNAFPDTTELQKQIFDQQTHNNKNKEDSVKETQEKVIISKAIQKVDEERAAGRGLNPSALERMARSALIVKTPWDEQIIPYLANGSDSGKNYKKPKKNRMYLQGVNKPIIPSKGNRLEKDIIFAVDTSGSMSDKDIQNAANHIYSFVQKNKTRYKTTMEIWSCDAGISCDYKLNEYDSLPNPLVLQGMGGTSFIPVFEQFLKDTKFNYSNKVKTLVYITDTYGDAPEVLNKYPEVKQENIIWLVTGCSSESEAKQNLPFGKIIIVE